MAMRRWMTAVGVLLALSSPRALAAQRLVTLGLGGGVSIPQGDLGRGANAGWNALGTLILSTPMQPLGLRADVAYNQFPFSAATTNTLGASGNQRVGSLTANVTYRLPTPDTPVSPHLIAGLGAYRTDCSLDGCQADTHFGWNAGLGMNLYMLGVRSFVEARYHRVRSNLSSVNYFPVTLGLVF
jgi:hypothetical protein